jgi:hypothetical protein
MAMRPGGRADPVGGLPLSGACPSKNWLLMNAPLFCVIGPEKAALLATTARHCTMPVSWLSGKQLWFAENVRSIVPFTLFPLTTTDCEILGCVSR